MPDDDVEGGSGHSWTGDSDTYDRSPSHGASTPPRPPSGRPPDPAFSHRLRHGCDAGRGPER